MEYKGVTIEVVKDKRFPSFDWKTCVISISVDGKTIDATLNGFTSSADEAIERAKKFVDAIKG